jgi:hypothetical protein
MEIKVSGYPPYKDRKFSIRNPKHKHCQRFVVNLVVRSALDSFRQGIGSIVDLTSFTLKTY